MSFRLEHCADGPDDAGGPDEVGAAEQMRPARIRLERPVWRSYNASVDEHELQQMRQWVGFSDEDAARVLALRAAADAVIEPVVENFYEVLLSHPDARAVFTGGEEQIARQRVLLGRWCRELFAGDYGQSYLEARLSIGRTHVRVGLPQRFMLLGVEVIWQGFRTRLANPSSTERTEQLASLHKLLMLDLAMMLESYKESYSAGIRESERDAMREQLTRAEHLAEIGQLAASLAHEIKNPLAGISGAIQVMREGMEPRNPHRPILTEILDQIRRLDAVVKDLLLYARPNDPKRRRVPVSDIVSNVLRVLREEPALRQKEVVRENGTGEAEVIVDPGQIEQVLINLLLNAAHATRKGDRIVVGSSADNGRVNLFVRDHGDGIPDDVRKQAFEAFFTTKAKGTGLGLSICKRIVDAHGGEIDLRPADGGGTLAIVSIPSPQDTRTDKGGLSS